ncbi:MAG: 30S ribosomal protein S9 [Amoebophilaceae bacterium]|nr:30S ribosomal protein S9 [Amoebophilaceae bacterium]
MKAVHAVGRRKSAVARVYLVKGKGDIKVNSRTLLDYFPVEEIALVVKQPFEKLKLVDQYDMRITVAGGGLRGQSEAIMIVMFG